MTKTEELLAFLRNRRFPSYFRLKLRKSLWFSARRRRIRIVMPEATVSLRYTLAQDKKYGIGKTELQGLLQKLGEVVLADDFDYNENFSRQ